ncbi:acid protease [Aspergillus steynii IBT 23096]|uniref:Acid protease n=1 Tax=Aspergillus steynii IBT 23096 TaxID=1392250 RepID=A0A2I2G6T8_9EURO|nr:acid protease [Aspergillus steynii IBT 23096]PLB48588.1 acid protease [Aspergillus steynii IBT 23096]
MSRQVLSLAAVATLLPSAWGAVVDLPVHFDNSYAQVEASIGTPPKTYLLHFDTGSATTWVVGKGCLNCPNGSRYERVGYGTEDSSTGSYIGIYGTIDYSGGVTSGPGITDMFGLPTNAQGENGLHWNQSFMAADQSSWRFIPADGFLGLAFSTIADAGATTLMETLMQNDLLDEPRFAVYYGTNFDTTGSDPAGVLTLGGSHEDRYVDGELTYVPLQQEAEFQVWRTKLSSITGTGKTAGQSSRSTTSSLGDYGRAVFDTGSGYFQVPTNIIDDLYESIGMNWTAILNGHIPLCTEFNSSWSVTLNFGESETDPKVTMTGEQLARPGFAHRDDACYPPFDDSEVVDLALIGTPLLHQFYTVFDFGANEVANYSPRIGFGNLKEELRPHFAPSP